MIYDVKTVIKGVEVFEQRNNFDVDEVAYSQPFIFNVTFENNATLGAMEIGSTASDVLTFSMINPFNNSFDGERVELWVSPTDGVESISTEIEEMVGDSTEVASIDEAENETDVEETEEEGEPITPEELIDVETTNEVDTENTFMQLEGEADNETVPDEPEPTEWIKLGVFYVRQQTTNDDGSVTLKCYDGFSLMNNRFIPTNPSDTAQNIFDDLREQALANCGITIAEFEFDDVYNINLDWVVDTTYRDAIGYLAGLVGGFAAFDADGVCNISFYGYNGMMLIRSELLSIVEDSAGEMLLTEIRCNNSKTVQEDWIESGAGQGIEFKNPFVTQEVLDSILETYNGIRYMGGMIVADWMESINAGEFVRVFTAEEYANYLAINNEINTGTHTDAELLELKENINSLGEMFLVSSQIVTLDGDARTSITSANGTESAKTNKQMPPIMKEIIEAGKTATNYIWQDEDGALRISRDTDNYSVRIDADSLDILNGDDVIVSFGTKEYTSESIYAIGETSGSIGSRTTVYSDISTICNFTDIVKVEVWDSYFNSWNDATSSSTCVINNNVITLTISNFGVTGERVDLLRFTGTCEPFAGIETNKALTIDSLNIANETTAKKINCSELSAMLGITARGDIKTFADMWCRYLEAETVNSNGGLTAETYLTVGGNAFVYGDATIGGSLTIGDHASEVGYTDSGSFDSKSLPAGNTGYQNLGYITLKPGTWTIQGSSGGSIAAGKRFGIQWGYSTDNGATVTNYLASRQLTTSNATGNHFLQATYTVKPTQTTRFYLRVYHNNTAATTFEGYWNVARIS